MDVITHARRWDKACHAMARYVGRIRALRRILPSPFPDNHRCILRFGFELTVGGSG